jgi:peptidoglycan/LPS O-acetylase OafA/YrhL
MVSYVFQAHSSSLILQKDSYDSPERDIEHGHDAPTVSLRTGSLLNAAKPILLRTATLLLPSYVHWWFSSNSSNLDPITPTSYLDGLRGFAALFVFVSHFSEPFEIHKAFGYGYGDNRNLLQLPIIRLFYSGNPMVAIFFVISGYVLSHKPLSLLRKRAWKQLLDNMCSAIFRRGIRLFLPTVASTFIVMLTVYLRIEEFAGYNDLPGYREPRPTRFPTFLAQLGDWVRFIAVGLLNPWQWDSLEPIYDTHLWTIPIEFKASLVLFVTFFGLAKARITIRLAISAGLITYLFYFNAWQVALFIGGMSLSELDQNRLQSPSNKSTKRYFYVYLSPVLFTAALFILSYPSRHGAETPGYRWLSLITARYRHWESLGAFLLLHSLSTSPFLQVAFTNRFARYLGRTSYALYLVHGPVLHSIGYGVVVSMWGVTGNETPLRYQLGFVLSFGLVSALVFWVADVFWRVVDAPTVGFARWVFQKVENVHPLSVEVPGVLGGE